MAGVDFKKVLQKPIIAVSSGSSLAPLSFRSVRMVLLGFRSTHHVCCFNLFVMLPLQSESMMGEMSMEALEIVTSAVDKFLSTENYEVRPRCQAHPKLSI